MNNEYSIIGFYIILMILINIVSVGYGDAILNNANFVSEISDIEGTDDGNSSISSVIEHRDIFGVLGFMLFVELPETSKFANAITVYRLLYYIIVIPYSLLIGYIILRMLIPWHK